MAANDALWHGSRRFRRIRKALSGRNPRWRKFWRVWIARIRPRVCHSVPFMATGCMLPSALAMGVARFARSCGSDKRKIRRKRACSRKGHPGCPIFRYTARIALSRLATARRADCSWKHGLQLRPKTRCAGCGWRCGLRIAARTGLGRPANRGARQDRAACGPRCAAVGRFSISEEPWHARNSDHAWGSS